MEEKNLIYSILVQSIFSLGFLLYFSFMIVKSYKALGNQKAIIKIKKLPAFSIVLICIGLLGLFFTFGGFYQRLERVISTVLIISLALSAYKISFITETGIITKGKLIQWQDIQLWKWKEGSYKEIVLNAFIKQKVFGKIYSSKEVFVLKVKNNQVATIDEILKKYIGSKCEKGSRNHK